MDRAALRNEEPPAKRSRARRFFRFRGPRAGGRYTRFVTWMRITLPVVAGVLVLLVVVWPQLGDEGRRFRLFDKSALDFREGSDQQAVNARFTGVDRENRPFTLIADSATQSQKAPDVVALAFPKADVTMKDGAWVAISGAEGLYHRNGKTLDVEGQVTLFHDSGFEMRTDSAKIDFDTGVATGNRPVTGHGPFGTMSAKGFRVEENGKRLLFEGKSRLVFWPKAREGQKKP